MPAKGMLRMLPVTLIAALCIANAPAWAEQQRAPGTFFGGFDLKSAVLSPVPLGPPSQFEPQQTVAPQAAQPDTPPAQAEAPPPPAPVRSAGKPAPKPSAKPRPKIAAPAKRPRTNPLNAYARDTRPRAAPRQVWPCVGTGICTWTQPR
ncbi:hypothetical protein [Afipia sp. P52-10]|jgi:hypothetical protein|uniref:hypothetical protein n=1 Tax=Afipia sp. P52-10 TaxID=1429916 RepID=UPI0004B604D3|nr:hypothetical protein [Afipia sp. P52-10]